MSPILVALIQVVLIFAAFWTTATIPSAGRKWLLRIAAVIVFQILSAAVVADERAAMVAGEYTF